MQDQCLCQKCGMRLRYEIRMYDPNALYLDTKSPDLLIKTQNGTSVGCFYCFPVRRVAKGFVYLSDSVPKIEQDKKNIVGPSQYKSDEARVYEELPKRAEEEPASK